MRLGRNRRTRRPKHVAMNASASQSLRTPARNELIRTSLLNAQHWLDHGTALISRGPLGDWRMLVIAVERHLIEAVAALRDGSPRSSAVVRQLDATTRSTNHYWYAVLAWCGRRKVRTDRVLERAMDRIYEKIDLARSLLDLSDEMVEAAHDPAAQIDDLYEAMAVEPTLDLVRMEAERALIYLGGKDAHVHEIVETVACVLERYVDHAVFLIALHDGNDATFTERVTAASDAVLALQRGVDGRYRTPGLRAQFDRVNAGLAMLRAAVHHSYGEMAKVVAYHTEAA